MVILALDLGTKTGWAVYSSDKTIKSGTQDFKTTRFDGGGMRYLEFGRWLKELNKLSGGFKEIYFEEVRNHSSVQSKGFGTRRTFNIDAAHAYGGFLATLTSWCEAESIPYKGVSVGTIKKHITGKGNAGKDAVKDSVKKKLNIIPGDDNEADALALLSYVIKEVI